MKIVLLGAAGSGKGTLCSALTSELKIPAISTGDLFRDNIKNKTPIGIEAEKYVNSGIPVPDGVVLEMLKQRIEKSDCKNGFLLDGYPRSLAQAKTLQKIANIDFVFNLNVSREVLLLRIAGRRVCENCKYTSHTDYLNGKDVCPKCGGKMKQRKDDQDPVAIENRLKTMYFDIIEPILDFYKKQGILHEVSADHGNDETLKQVSQVLKK